MSTPLTAFVDELPLPRRLRATDHGGRITVAMCPGRHRFHRDLPESTVWGYDGTAPGPTIEAERGQPVTVEWRNELRGAFPVVATVAPTATDHAAFHYPMDQRAALLWYHDHVMGVTKFDVYAGLAGLWIIRDERERALDLVLDVQPSVSRFRVLNGSNARTSLNTARAPFDGSSFAAADAADAADLDGLLPQVMRFRVGAGATTQWRIPRGLATDYEPPAADALVEAPHRTIALVERELDGEPNMLTMRELAPAADDHAGPVVTSREESGRRAIGSLPPSSRTRQPSSRC